MNGNGRQRVGIVNWGLARRDLRTRVLDDPTCIVKTMVDYYGLPASEGRAWPGRAKASDLPHAEKAPCVERAVLQDLEADPRRFVPFAVMHEFQALLFTDCAAFARGIDRPAPLAYFQSMRN